MAAPDTRTTGCLVVSSGLVVGSGCGRAMVSPTAVLGFGSGIAGTKAMGFHSPMVGGGGVVLGRGAVVGGIALGLMVDICCRVVWMALLVLVRSFLSTSMNVCAAAIVRCWGAGCRGVVSVGATCLPLVLDSSALAVVNSSMASMTQV